MIVVTLTAKMTVPEKTIDELMAKWDSVGELRAIWIPIPGAAAGVTCQWHNVEIYCFLFESNS